MSKYFDFYKCPHCDTKLNDWSPISKDSSHFERSCDCGMFTSIYGSDHSDINIIMLKLYPIKWTIFIVQIERKNGWCSYAFKAAPVNIEGSNIFNLFTSNINWMIALDDLPDFMHTAKARSPQALAKQLDLLLTFA